MTVNPSFPTSTAEIPIKRPRDKATPKYFLMTNEKGLFAQADLRNVRGSTIERKIMSTKTTTKRISLVVAAALAFGGFSAVSAHAAYTQNPATLPFIKDTTTVNVAAAGAVSLATGQSGVTYTKGVLANSVTGIVLQAPMPQFYSLHAC